MAYITEQDLIDLFGEEEIIDLSNLDNPNATTVNSVRVTAAIAQSEDILHTYASAYYSIPLVPIDSTVPIAPPSVRGILLDHARYHLDINRPREDVRVRYEDGLEWLLLLAKGKVSLGDNYKRKAELVLEKPAGGPIGIGGATGSSEPIYTKELLDGFY